MCKKYENSVLKWNQTDNKKFKKRKKAEETKDKKKKKKVIALTGNRTRASRVAGENSTTEPSVLPVVFLLTWQQKCKGCLFLSFQNLAR